MRVAPHRAEALADGARRIYEARTRGGALLCPLPRFLARLPIQDEVQYIDIARMQPSPLSLQRWEREERRQAAQPRRMQPNDMPGATICGHG
jgi:hypothetical protein